MKKVMVFLMYVLVFSLSVGGGPSLSEAVASETVEDYPKKNIECLIGFASGGGSDVLFRTIMQYVDIPVNFIPTNIEGSGGYIAAVELSNRAPDGYSIAIHNPSSILGWDLAGTSDTPLWKDLTTICTIAEDYYLIATNKKTGWKSFDDIVAYAKEHPGDILWGNNGSGSIQNAIALAIAEKLGIDVTMVPYEGGASTRTALLGGHIQLMTSTSGDTFAYEDIIPLAVFLPERSSLAPNVPTTIELGVNVMCGLPRSIYGPPNMSPDVVAYLSEKFHRATENPEYAVKCKSLGMVASYTPGDLVLADVTQWYEDLKPIFERFQKK
jgi:tripartite-type tricarboxylate transporter receptor subunit TctC